MTASARYRVTSPTVVDIHTGAMFAQGEEAIGFDPEDPHDARLLAEGRVVELQETAAPAPSDAVVKKAQELSVDLSTVKGTGARGAILVGDVENAHKASEEASNE